MPNGLMTAMEVLTLLGCTEVTAKPYTWSYSYLGADFFGGWTFWTGPDPSGGAVQYVDFAEATKAGLVNATPSRVYLGVDMGPIYGDASRRSVRIQSTTTYNQGLFVTTIDHAPTGCSLWPAFWMYGEDPSHVWPKWGEYDIIEGIHQTTHVMTSLHTSAQCDQSRAPAGSSSRNWMPGPSGLAADNCDIFAPGQFRNQGCSQQGPDASVGSGFNAAGGGTYAAEWDPAARHIRTWFWPRGLEPPDLAQRRPDPDMWGVPYSYFSLEPDVCPPSHFANMRLVFDITFCGDLGGATFERDCPEVAASMSCPEFVRKHPESMGEAYWSIRALDVYQQPGMPVGGPAPPGEAGPAGRSFPRTILCGAVFALLCSVLATVLGIVFAGFVRRKMQTGEIRCPNFYERCLTEVCDGSEEERMNSELVFYRTGVESYATREDPMAASPYDQRAMPLARGASWYALASPRASNSRAVTPGHRDRIVSL